MIRLQREPWRYVLVLQLGGVPSNPNHCAFSVGNASRPSVQSLWAQSSQSIHWTHSSAGRELEYQSEQIMHFQSTSGLMRHFLHLSWPFPLPIEVLGKTFFSAITDFMAGFALNFFASTSSNRCCFSGVLVRIEVRHLLRFPRFVFLGAAFFNGRSISGLLEMPVGRLTPLGPGIGFSFLSLVVSCSTWLTWSTCSWMLGWLLCWTSCWSSWSRLGWKLDWTSRWSSFCSWSRQVSMGRSVT